MKKIVICQINSKYIHSSLAAWCILAGVREYCKKTGQYVPETVGEIMRCIYESLALKYRLTLGAIEECTEKKYNKLHVMGGGTKDKLLLQMTADCCELPVLGGPIEATALGNVALQLIASGDIKDIKSARRVIANGEKLTLYSPSSDSNWDDAFERFKAVIEKI